MNLQIAFNRFYHETKILAEEDQAKKESYLALLMLGKKYSGSMYRYAGI